MLPFVVLILLCGLAGVMLFLALTIVTLSTKPAPVKLAEDQISALQSKFAEGPLNLWRYRKKVNSMFGDEIGEASLCTWLHSRLCCGELGRARNAAQKRRASPLGKVKLETFV